ncbi:MAG: dicarboxylate/amino acid:cation symporter [Schleiferiaceae bacterium]|jgi:Na+/H+-dicarboxylate symporter|nr:dicarboxylate/amino acid:cation symporter [Schleiferiaceae bacterium]
MFEFFKKQPLHINIIIGLLLGSVWAYLSIVFGWNDFTTNWIAPFGTIFINLLKLIAVPLVLFSIISGVSHLSDASSLGRMGAKTIGFYLITTVFAVTVGLVVVNVVKPGAFADDNQRIVNRLSYELWVEDTEGVDYVDDQRFLSDPKYADFMTDAMDKYQEDISDAAVAEKVNQANNKEKGGPLDFVVDMVPSNIFVSFNKNLMLQIIVFALFFGISLIAVPKDKVQGVISFVNGANEVFIKMVELVMKAAPFFVFALLSGVLAKMAQTEQELFEIFKSLGVYALVVTFGLAFMVFVIYPLILSSLISKKTELSFVQAYKYFMKGIRPAQLLAFSTSSSAATLPVTMECVHENLGVDEEISSFVLPIGATVNMDGTSLYQAVAVIFLAQFHFIDLAISDQLIIILTATLASIGSAAVPSAGLIMLIVVLQSVNLNPFWIAIIFPIDRILDMCRTVVNVTGDATVSTMVAQTEGKLHYKI